MLDARWQSAWFALQVRSSRESLVTMALQRKGYEVLFPRYECVTNHRGKTERVFLPLFPDYLFCRFDSTIPGRIISTPGVIRIVGIGNHPVPISEEEIQAVASIVKSRVPAEPWPYLTRGHTVKLVSGPLTGLEGILIEIKDRSRIVVSMTLLQRSVSVAVDARCVIPASPESAAKCRDEGLGSGVLRLRRRCDANGQ